MGTASMMLMNATTHIIWPLLKQTELMITLEHFLGAAYLKKHSLLCRRTQPAHSFFCVEDRQKEQEGNWTEKV